jgi:hypothetical protein
LFKTNAPPDVIYDIFKEWKKLSYGGDEEKMKRNIQENSLAARVLQKESKVKPNFDET